MRTFCNTVAAFLVFGFTGSQAQTEETDINLFLKMRTRQLFEACGGEAPQSCSCASTPDLNVTGPFDANVNALAAGLVLGGCNPNFCRCADAPDVEVDVRMYEMKVIMDLCPRNKMSRCLCHDNTVMKAPFDLEIFFFQCRPKKCKCVGERRPRIVTGFGCRKGGAPFCPEWDFECSNGLKMTQNTIFEYYLSGKSTCPCPDGLKATCKSTGEAPLCPDGSAIAPELGSPGGYYDRCNDIAA